MMFSWLIGGTIGGTVVFAYYLKGLTANEAVATRRLRARPYALGLLLTINSATHATLARNRVYCRIFNASVLKSLRDEITGLLQPSWKQPASLAFFGLFYGVYSLCWLKQLIIAGKDDVRALLGLEMLLLRFQ